MPSPMIHLLVAYYANPKAPDLFWVGNIAPDYMNDRQYKDEIHLRNASNRMESLGQLRKGFVDINPFEIGWLLHLFTDACWDETMIPAFQQKHKDARTFEDWFVKYREQTLSASFYLYHHCTWTHQIWAQILNADLTYISSKLPITRHDAEGFRDRVYKRHFESDQNSASLEYREDLLFDFSQKTARKFMEWL